NANQMPANSELPGSITNNRFSRRLDLMRELEEDFADSGARSQVTEHRSIYASAANLVRSPRLRAFDLSAEQATVRDQYGRTPVAITSRGRSAWRWRAAASAAAASSARPAPAASMWRSGR